jgi:hypothetical protein
MDQKSGSCISWCQLLKDFNRIHFSHVSLCLSKLTYNIAHLHYGIVNNNTQAGIPWHIASYGDHKQHIRVNLLTSRSFVLLWKYFYSFSFILFSKIKTWCWHKEFAPQHVSSRIHKKWHHFRHHLLLNETASCKNKWDSW